MGLLDFAESVVETVIEKFTPAVQAVVKLLPPPVLALLPPAITLVELINTLKAVVIVLEAVDKTFGGNQDFKDLGDRVQQYESSTGRKPEDFDSYDDYMEEINNFELDPEESNKIPEEVKLARGISTWIEQMEEKGIELADLLPEVFQKPDYYTAERVVALLDSFSKADLAIRDISKYMDSKLNGTETGRIEDAIVKAETSLECNKDKTEAEIRDEVQDVRRY